MLALNLRAGRCRGPPNDFDIGFRTGEECLNQGATVFLKTEYGANPGLDMPVKQGIGKVSSGVNNDVAGLENLQMPHRAKPFIGMLGEVEIKRQARFQLIEATDQPLRIDGRFGRKRVAPGE